jgi:hypothetical protein
LQPVCTHFATTNTDQTAQNWVVEHKGMSNIALSQRTYLLCVLRLRLFDKIEFVSNKRRTADFRAFSVRFSV